MKAFFDAVRPMFGGQLTPSQVSGMETLLAAMEGLPISHRAYLLATAMHETAQTMQPVRETLAKDNATAIRRLDDAFAKGKLLWVSAPYWREGWFGRGYVQLTHKANYIKAGNKLGVDLVNNPDMALQPTIAAMILVRGCSEGWFTGKHLDEYLPGDYIGARRVVNGTDRAVSIAKIAATFEAALLTKPESKPPSLHPPIASPRTWLSALIEMIKAFFRGRK